jgi:tRNA(Ile)-lysidine synthase
MPTHPFLRELADGLGRCGVRDDRVLVAVSGGADSVALLWGLSELASEFSLELFVAHLNHQLRGAESDADATWVAQLARGLNVRCEIGLASEEELTADASHLEETARQVRYRFLDEMAAKFNYPTIALAHTFDDQVETVLHRLLRGTGISGLVGMRSVRQSEQGFRLVRPMLAIRRSTVEDYLRERRQTYRTDSTNLDTTMTRNRLRHVVLPSLRDQVNPQVDAAIARLAEQASELDDFLSGYLNQLLSRALRGSQPDVCHVDVRELAAEPAHIVRELFRLLWKRQGWPLQAMGYEQWNRLAQLLTSKETITLSGQIEARFHSEWMLVLRRTTPS